MKKSILFLVLFISGIAVSQSLNTYKYALVESKFKFQKSPNQFNLNVLTKLYFQKIGMQSFLDSDVLPTEVANENCNKIYVSAEENSNMFSTKIKIIIKDCQNKILFTSDEGMSREKSYETAYNQAFRIALTSVERLKYKYSEKKQEVVTEKSSGRIGEPASTENHYAVLIPYTANKITNGYKLFHGEQGLKFVIYETSNPNVFIVNSSDGKNQIGVLIHKQTDDYSFEYYKDGKLIQENINILF
jgi:hypothetical protein